MKLHCLTLLLLTALVLQGCIDEDLSSCPKADETNLRLDFSYTDEGGADIFTNNIDGVDVFVYDTNGLFVKQRHVGKGDLSVFAGTELSLCPGDYRIVCWGNVGDKTTISEPTMGSPFGEAIVKFATPKTRAATQLGGDPLYYAPYDREFSTPKVFMVSVPERGMANATIHFRNAHINIELYVKGYTDKNAAGQSLLPNVEMTGICAGYYFDLQTFGPPVTYKGVTTHQMVDGEEMAVVDFRTPLFLKDIDKKILIKKQSDGSLLTSVNLEEFISDNNIDINNTIRVTIPILVEFKDVEVSVRLPSWYRVPVEPEM